MEMVWAVLCVHFVLVGLALAIALGGALRIQNLKEEHERLKRDFLVYRVTGKVERENGVEN